MLEHQSYVSPYLGGIGAQFGILGTVDVQNFALLLGPITPTQFRFLMTWIGVLDLCVLVGIIFFVDALEVSG